MTNPDYRRAKRFLSKWDTKKTKNKYNKNKTNLAKHPIARICLAEG
jgi:hypothetical protein